MPVLDVVLDVEVKVTPVLPQKLTIAEALERAAEMISGPGKWCQRKSHDGFGGVCAGAALIHVIDPTYYPSHFEAVCGQTALPPLYLKAYALLSGVHDAFLIGYNDDEGRTQQDMVDFLMTGANVARERGI